MRVGDRQHKRLAAEHFVDDQVGKAVHEQAANFSIGLHRLETSEARRVLFNSTERRFHASHEVGRQLRIDLQIVARRFDELALGRRIEWRQFHWVPFDGDFELGVFPIGAFAIMVRSSPMVWSAATNCVSPRCRASDRAKITAAHSAAAN